MHILFIKLYIPDVLNLPLSLFLNILPVCSYTRRVRSLILEEDVTSHLENLECSYPMQTR